MKILLSLLIFHSLSQAENGIHEFKIRALEVDPTACAYPEIGFLITDQKGKPADYQHARVDTSVKSRDRLVIWNMSYQPELARLLNSYGLHVIQVHYARHWFSICCKERPVGENCRGNMRLEAATGEDHSPEVKILERDSLKGRAVRFVKHLAKKNPAGKWERFLTKDRSDLIWEKVILAGSSHGATTSARLAKHTKVARVVCFCGPRDHFQTWQSLPSATPKNRYFGYSHVLDGGWTGDHYCRSWEMMGLHEFGPIVNVERAKPPYQNTRRLITDLDVKKDAKRAHGAVTPKKFLPKTKDGQYVHEPVWRYLFTHPVDQVGRAVPMDDSCLKTHPQ